MNQVQELLHRLERVEVSVQLAQGDDIKIRGKKENLTSELIDELKANKSSLLELLQKNHASNEMRDCVIRTSNENEATLSFAQQRIWFTESIEANSARYNMPTASLLVGELDQSHLCQSINDVVRRHHVLRTTYHDRDGVPYQRVEEFQPLSIEVIDLQQQALAIDSPALALLLKEEAHLSFDLSRDTMLRAKLLCLSSTEHVLLMTVHHIASDGWSLGLLAREISINYKRYQAADARPIPELQHQYIDYANWQAELESKGVLQQQVEFWKEQLAGLPQTHNLPLDFTRPAVQTFNSDCVQTRLRPELARGLNDLAKAHNTTLFVVLQTAYAVFLSRWSNEQDIVIGTPVAGRTHAELEPIVGFFVNTLILRSQVDPELSFDDFLDRCQMDTQNAFAHQMTPFDVLVSELKPERSLSQSALVQVLFSLRNHAEPDLELPNIHITSLDNQFETLKFDLELVVTEQADGLLMLWNYAVDLFEKKSIEHMAASFNRLLEEILIDSTRQIAQLPLLTSEASLAIIEQGVAAAQHSDRTVNQLFENWAISTPQEIALQFGSQQISYQNLNARANRLARHLQDNDLQKEDKVAICCERSIEMIVAMLAIVKAGGAYVMLDPAYPQERLEYMLADSQAKLILVDESQGERMAAVPVLALRLDNAAAYQNYSDSDLSPVDNRDLACVVYTSGSTGKPKGAMLEHEGIVRLVESNWLVDFQASDIVAHGSNCAFDLAFLEIWGALSNGSTLCYVARDVLLDTQALRHFLAEQKITILMATTALFNQIATLAPDIFANLRIVFFGGEQADMNAINEVVRHGKPGRLINAYGPAENSCTSTAYDILDKEHDYVPIGRAISGSHHVVLDQNEKIVPIGVIGELCVGGHGLARGYLNRPELTEQRFISDPFRSDQSRLYKTGDLVRYRNDGNLEFIGRTDTQVKIRGFRIELNEIEAVLSSMQEVARTLVRVQRDDGNARLVAYVVPQSSGLDDAPLIETLNQNLKAQLPAYMLPTAIMLLDALPLTENGKVDSKALPVVQDFAADVDYCDPITATEHALAAIWCELLGTKRVSRNASFFDIGGHSLLATRLVSAVATRLACPITIRDVFQNDSLQTLAKCIDQRADMELMPELVAAPIDSELLSSFAQQRLWFVDQLQGHATPGQYNINLGFRVTGELNLPFLEYAINHIVERHKVLRTSYHSEGGQLSIITHKEVATPLQQFLCDDISEDELSDRINSFASTQFDLSDGCMLKTQIHSISEYDHILLFCFHHIASDGWSAGIFISELQQIYAQLERGRPVSLEPLAVQYSDFAHWQRQLFQGSTLDKQIAYWTHQLAGLPVCHNLPLDNPRPDKPRLTGDTVRTEASPALTARIRALAHEQGVTMFMFYQAAFSALLGRWSHSDDIVMGTPIAGRQLQSVENLIGFFVNTLVLRSDLSTAETFRSLLEQTREMAIDAFENQDVPFEMLVEKLSPARSLNHSPLFQILFSMHNHQAVELTLGETEISTLEVNNQTVKFDLSLHVVEADQQDSIIWEYNTELFDQSTIERLAAHLLILLEQVTDFPDVGLDQLQIITDQDKQTLLNEFRATDQVAPNEQMLHHQFEKQANAQPDKTALEWGNTLISYAELNDRANRVAHYMISQEIGSKKLVGICLRREPDLLVALLAVLKTGNAYVPLDPNYPNERLQQIIAESGLTTVITSCSELDSLPEQIGTIQIDDVSLYEHLSPENLPTNGHCEDLAYVLFTSGSTGKPKGVKITHRNVSSLMRWVESEFTPEQLDRILLSTSLNFDPSVLEIFAVFCLGYTGVLVDNGLAPIEQNLNVSFMATVPSVVRALSDNCALPESLKVLGAGGEALTTDLVNEVTEAFPSLRLYNFYGPTECTVNATCDVFDQPITGMPPVGRPLANTNVYVLSKQQQLLPIGAIGELYIGGDSVGQGYLHDEQMTAQRFSAIDALPQAGRLYRTGDMVRFQPGGRLLFLGRIDQQVKIRGFRVELGEIEHRLESHPSVEKAVVLIRQFAQDKRLIAYLVFEQDVRDEQLTEHCQMVREFVASALPEYMVPAAFEKIDQIPLLPNGKVNKKALPEPTIVSEENIVHADSPAEQDLRGIWSSVLDIPAEQISVTQNFFNLGGHSLLIIDLLKCVNDKFDSHLSVPFVYEQPTIRQMAQCLTSDKQQNRQVKSLVMMKDGDKHLPPLFFIHPVGGDLLCYATLSSNLNTKRAVYGLQRCELSNHAKVAYPSISELANAYWQEISALQNEGPYRLIGWSLGGMIAIKLAELIEAKGHTVEYLGVIDTVDHAGCPQVLAELGINQDTTESFAQYCQSLEQKEQFFKIFDAAFQVEHLLKIHQGLSAEYVRELIFSGVLASLNFSPDKPVNALHYYAATKTLEDAPEAAINGILKCSNVPCGIQSIEADHHSLMLQPAVRQLAQLINLDLNQ